MKNFSDLYSTPKQIAGLEHQFKNSKEYYDEGRVKILYRRTKPYEAHKDNSITTAKIACMEATYRLNALAMLERYETSQQLFHNDINLLLANSVQILEHLNRMKTKYNYEIT